MKNLLIGNGLNLTNYEANSFLLQKNVANRFINNLKSYWDIICKLVDQEKMNMENIVSNLNPDDGIEKVAGDVFKYIHNKITLNRKYIRNYDYRLIEVFADIAIKSLFFIDNTFKLPIIDDKYINKINSYDKVYTLNYIEDWDKDNKITYLHGNLKKYIDSYCDIGSSVLSSNKDYCLFKPRKYKKIDFKEIVFMPINDIMDKHNYIVLGLYPGDDLFPADDIFPYDGRDIYKDLDNIDNIEIFGMSPYGDEAIINRLKHIKNIRIYVYEMKKDEIDKWRSYGIKADFVDSSKFIE